jgi:hypothetical protein
MAVSTEQAVGVLNKLVEQLGKRQNDSGKTSYGVDTLTKAYDGDFQLRYASDSFKEYFAGRYTNFSDNWCGIVADAPHERLEPIGIRLRGENEGDKGLWASWVDNDADALCDLALLDAIVAKRSFAQVWGTKDDEAVISWGHPSQMIVGYDPATRARVSGAQVWRDGDMEFAALDWSGFLWKFERAVPQTSALEDAGFVMPPGLMTGGWTPRQPAEDDVWPLKNPMGKVSFVELPNRPRLVGEPISDIAGTLSMQHAINLLWAQLFAVSDEATIGQRAIIGAEQPVTPILDGDGNVIGERPVDLKKLRQDDILWITDPGAKAHEWTPAKLDVFTSVIEIAVGHIAAQTRTPAHYLLIGGTIANVSGDAMKALETGLVKRTEEKTQHFGRSIRDVFELVALAKDDDATAAAVRGGKVLWKDVENRSDAQRADALSKKRDIGYPLRYLLELDGLPPEEIERVMAMVVEEGTDPVLARILRPTPTNEPGATSGDDGDADSGV